MNHCSGSGLIRALNLFAETSVIAGLFEPQYRECKLWFILRPLSAIPLVHANRSWPVPQTSTHL